MTRALAARLLLLATVSWGHGHGAPAASGSLDEEVVLAAGQSVSVAEGALRLKFDSVVTDSRCPAKERCVSAGSAEIAVTVTVGERSTAVRLFVGAEPTSTTVGAITVELRRLDPYPVTSRAIPPADYRATFRVRRE